MDWNFFKHMKKNSLLKKSRSSRFNAMKCWRFTLALVSANARCQLRFSLWLFLIRSITQTLKFVSYTAFSRVDCRTSADGELCRGIQTKNYQYNQTLPARMAILNFDQKTVKVLAAKYQSLEHTKQKAAASASKTLHNCFCFIFSSASLAFISVISFIQTIQSLHSFNGVFNEASYIIICWEN